MSFLEGISEPARPLARHGQSPSPSTTQRPLPTPPASGVVYQPSPPDTDLPPTYRVPTLAPAGEPSLTAAQMLAKAVYGMVADAGVSGRWVHDPADKL